MTWAFDECGIDTIQVTGRIAPVEFLQRLLRGIVIGFWYNAELRGTLEQIGLRLANRGEGLVQICRNVAQACSSRRLRGQPKGNAGLKDIFQRLLDLGF